MVIALEATLPKYLIQRRRVWFAIMEIPKPLRSKFGKVRFKQTLETESLSVAERRVMPVVAHWKRLIDLAKSNRAGLEGELASWRVEIERYKRQGLSDEEIDDIALDVAYNLHDDAQRGAELYAITKGDWVLLSEHINDFAASLDNEPKTIDMKRRDVERLSGRFKYAHDVTNRAVVNWVENELVANDGLSYATCRRIISACRAYWNFLNRVKGFELADPFANCVPKANTKSAKTSLTERRKGFRAQDYQKLFKATAGASLPLSELIQIAAYTGARIEEICSLKIDKIDGDRIHIEEAKTEAGWRVIPIHPEIRELVANLKGSSEDGYLLPRLTFNKYGDRSNAIGKQFGRLKTKAGYGPDYVFHSFRKGVATQLEAAGVPENVAARLLGHEFRTMTYGLYSGGMLPFEVLQEALGKVDWTV